jgi:F-type H+-transporting ATPase subunit epsilon
MALIHLTIVTPEAMYFDADAQRVMVRTTGGDVAILARHIDYSAALAEKGEARVIEADGRVRRAEVEGGLLHVSNDNVQVITNHFRWKDA